MIHILSFFARFGRNRENEIAFAHRYQINFARSMRITALLPIDPWQTIKSEIPGQQMESFVVVGSESAFCFFQKGPLAFAIPLISSRVIRIRRNLITAGRLNEFADGFWLSSAYLWHSYIRPMLKYIFASSATERRRWSTESAAIVPECAAGPACWTGCSDPTDTYAPSPWSGPSMSDRWLCVRPAPIHRHRDTCRHCSRGHCRRHRRFRTRTPRLRFDLRAVRHSGAHQ